MSANSELIPWRAVTPLEHAPRELGNTGPDYQCDAEDRMLQNCDQLQAQILFIFRQTQGRMESV